MTNIPNDPDFSCAGMSLKEWEQRSIDDALRDIGDELNAALFGTTPKAKRNRRRP